MVRMILKTFGIWLLQQKWFQFEVVKLVTKASNAATEFTDKTENKVDDKIVSFLKRNKNPLLDIVKKEVDIDDTPIDALMAESIEKI